MKRALRRLLLACCVLGVLALVASLMAQLNHRRYRLRVGGGILRVERGLMLPLGFGQASQDVYAPLPVPFGEPFAELPIVDDRSALDRQLFDVLYGWAKPRLLRQVPADQDLALRYVARLERLPSLSEEQRQKLRQLRTEVAMVRAQHILQRLNDEVRAAYDALRAQLHPETPRHSPAGAVLGRLERALEVLAPPPPAAEATPGP